MYRFAAAFTGAVLVLTIYSFAALAGNAEILETECHKQLNLSDSGCVCIGERAESVLSEKQQELVVAMVTEDEAASVALRGQMTMDEIMGAATFMMETPEICAAQ